MTLESINLYGLSLLWKTPDVSWATKAEQFHAAALLWPNVDERSSSTFNDLCFLSRLCWTLHNMERLVASQQAALETLSI